MKIRSLGLAILATAAFGCGNSSNNNGVDMGHQVIPDLSTPDAPWGCTPNAKECVTDSLARVCPADGSGWLPVQCQPGDKCDQGDCKPDPNALCQPGSGGCIDATHGLVCNDNGMGYKMVTCPAKTSCAGAGQCQGSCVVGGSFCINPTTITTCADGNSFTTKACEAGSLCVDQGNGTAACLHADCTPDPNGCDQVCGNKTVAANNTDPGYLSFCQATPNGYKWVAVQCPSPSSCNPTSGGACTVNGALSQAGCAAECAPGQTRCTVDGLGTQTCGTDGKWPATTTSCNATPTGNAQACVQDPTMPGSAVCGDVICAFGEKGACEADGFHACVNGKVSATATPCNPGVCVTDGNSVGGFNGGSCVVQCQAGDQKCVGSTGYQTCVNGAWASTATACPSGTCQQYADGAGNPRTVCGACAPGTHQCTDNMGTAGGTTDIETCDMTGQWGAHAACMVGSCVAPGPNGPPDAICVADCMPGSTVCIGAAKTGVGTNAGTDTSGTCTAQGTLPMSGTTCATDTTCRVSQNGVATGCVECVGPTIAGGNEQGLVDTRCDASGALETCQSGNVWPASGTACGTMMSCQPQDNGNGLTGPTCRDCFGAPCTDAWVAAQGFGGCAAAGGGPPIQCGVTAGCCTVTCDQPIPATPASCQ